MPDGDSKARTVRVWHAHPDRAPRGIEHIMREPKPMGKDSIRGRLFDLGEYPGLVLPEQSLFVREKRMITLADGRKQKHWVYRYNQSTENAKAAA